MNNNGNIIMVNVGGKEYPTHIDENNVQRFFTNPVIVYLFTHNARGEESNHMIHDQMLNLNTLGVAYQKGCFDKREYAELNMALGYSVSGFADLSAFQDWEIENPIWEGK